METFGQRLRYARKAAVLTQQELADMAGIGVLSVTQLENDKRQPRPGTVRALAEALEVDVRWLAGSDLLADLAGKVAA